MIYLIYAPQPGPAGTRARLVINHPGDSTQAATAAQKAGYLAQGVQYKIEQVQSNDPRVAVLCEQWVMPTVSPQGMQGMQDPRGNPGQQRPDGPLDSLGFQELGDVALSAGAPDAMFGPQNDVLGTYTDLVGQPGNMTEIPRQR